MKASLKFREEKKPLVRAKIPLSVLGLPFFSGISAGDSKELCLNLSTAFEFGPCLKLSYRPNDSWNPFSLVVKTGVGPFGSPASAPMAMSAEFSLLSRGNPTFFLQFKPQIGDFSIKKTSGSPIAFQTEPARFFGRKINGHDRDAENDVEGPSIDGPDSAVENGIYAGDKADSVFSPNFRSAGGSIGRVLSGVEVSARSVLPLTSSALLKFRWGLRFPAELLEDRRRNPTAEISLRKVPLLGISKISIEHVAADGRKESGPRGEASSRGRAADVAEECMSVKSQLEALREENGQLRKAVDELRSEFGGRKSVSVAGSQESGGRKRDRKLQEVGDASEDELKKALMAASGGGGGAGN